jgi:hypothetical protein
MILMILNKVLSMVKLNKKNINVYNFKNLVNLENKSIIVIYLINEFISYLINIYNKKKNNLFSFPSIFFIPICINLYQIYLFIISKIIILFC